MIYTTKTVDSQPSIALADDDDSNNLLKSPPTPEEVRAEFSRTLHEIAPHAIVGRRMWDRETGLTKLIINPECGRTTELEARNDPRFVGSGGHDRHREDSVAIGVQLPVGWSSWDELLQDALWESQYSHRQFAEEADCHPSNVSAWTKRQRIPTDDMCLRILSFAINHKVIYGEVMDYADCG